MKTQELISLEYNLLPQQCPYLVEEISGLCFLCGIVKKLLDQERNSSRVKFDMVCKMKKIVSNYTDVSRN